MLPSEHDRIRAGLSEAQLRVELNLRRSELPTRVPAFESETPVSRIVFERIGHPMLDRPPRKSDTSALGAHIFDSDRPMPIATLARALDWEVDRVIKARDNLASQLPRLGLALFEYPDESIEIGPIATMLDETDECRKATLAARDAIALAGISVKEATILRNLMKKGLNFNRNSSGMSHKSLRALLKADLVVEKGRNVEIAPEIRALYSAWGNFGSQEPVE